MARTPFDPATLFAAHPGATVLLSEKVGHNYNMLTGTAAYTSAQMIFASLPARQVKTVTNAANQNFTIDVRVEPKLGRHLTQITKL